jgi:hypothetical protein
MFVGKDRAYHRVKHLTHKHQTRLEKLARDKHSSLLLKSVKYVCKKFYSTSPRTQGLYKKLIIVLKMLNAPFKEKKEIIKGGL